MQKSKLNAKQIRIAKVNNCLALKFHPLEGLTFGILPGE